MNLATQKSILLVCVGSFLFGILCLIPINACAIVLEPGPVIGNLPQGTTHSGSSGFGMQVSQNTAKALKVFNGVSSQQFLNEKSDFLNVNPSNTQTHFEVEAS